MSGIAFTRVLLRVGFVWPNWHFHFVVVAVGSGGILFVVFSVSGPGTGGGGWVEVGHVLRA